MRARLAAGDLDGALALFLETVGMPAPMIAGMRASPAWRPMTALAPTLPQDSLALDEANGALIPSRQLAAFGGPVLALAGEKSPSQLRTAAGTVARQARAGSYRVLPGQTHDVSVHALAPALGAFFAHG